MGPWAKTSISGSSDASTWRQSKGRVIMAYTQNTGRMPRPSRREPAGPSKQRIRSDSACAYMPAIFLFLFACRIRSRRDECRKSIPQAAGQPNSNDVTESLKSFQSAAQSKINSFSSLATTLSFLTRDDSLSVKTEQHAPPFSFHWLYPAIRRTARARPAQSRDRPTPPSEAVSRAKPYVLLESQ